MIEPKRCKVGFIWSNEFDEFQHDPNHPISKGRFTAIKDFLENEGFFAEPHVTIIEARPLSDELLRLAHSPEYIERVRRISETGNGDIDVDTPGYRGIYDTVRISCGGTIDGIRAIIQNEVDHFFSPTGGFHHAKYASGGGFCVFNDIAASVYELKRMGIGRILVADFDVHHGNGTQSYFYDDPEILQISFHEDPRWMYPHEGFVDEIGSGRGRGYKVNMPFPMDSGDRVYRYAFDELVPRLVDHFKPEFILFLPGFDAHYLDRLAHLKLTTDMITYVTRRLHQMAHRWSNGRLGVMSGGGYHPDALNWGAACVMSELSGHPYRAPTQTPPFDDDDKLWSEVRDNVEHIKSTVFALLGIE